MKAVRIQLKNLVCIPGMKNQEKIKWLRKMTMPWMIYAISAIHSCVSGCVGSIKENAYEK